MTTGPYVSGSEHYSHCQTRFSERLPAAAGLLPILIYWESLRRDVISLEILEKRASTIQPAH